MKKVLLLVFLSLAWLSVSAQALVPITWTAYGLTFEAPKGILVEEDTEETFLLNNSRFYITIQSLDSDGMTKSDLKSVLKDYANDDGVKDQSAVQEFELPQFFGTYLRGSCETDHCLYACLMTKTAGWRLSEEKFMKKLNWLDNLKLRVSWGRLGNNSIGNYEWQAVYATAPHYAFGNKEVPGLGMGSFSNYNLEWETTTVTNLGIDFSMLKNRLSGTVEVYNKLTDGILYNPTLSPTLSGFSSPRQNIAEVTNKGLEITLGWNDRIGSVSYGISGNFSYNKNEVTKYKGELVRGWQQNADGSSTYYTNLGEVSTGDLQRVLEGHMINEFYVLNVYKGNRNYFNADGTVNPKGGPSDGMIRTEDDMKWLQAMTNAGYKFYPKQGIGKSNIWYGDIIYADLDGDGIYGDDDDKDFQGYSKTPKYYFGFQTNLSWKGIDFSMNWAGAAGFKINWYQSGENSSITWFGYGIGKDVAYDHYFYDPENPNDPRTNLTSANPRLTMDKAAQVSVSGQHILHNGNYLKLKNLTVGYTLPKDWVQKVCMQNVRVYVSGENLLTITKFKGIDPEMMSGVGYAPMRQYAFGVNVTF